jgi:hypothetical protein
VFFVYNNCVARYNPSSPRKVDSLATNGLDAGSILVTDASSNIYALDPYNGVNKIKGFKFYSGKLISTFSKNMVTRSILTKAHLLARVIKKKPDRWYTLYR